MTAIVPVMRKTLREHVASSPVTVDREKGVLRGVKVLGTSSKNGRRYSEAVIQAATAKYEGLRSFVNHPSDEELERGRPYQDLVGMFENARCETKGGEFGLFCDVRLRKGSPHYESLLSDAEDEHFRSAIGVSHVAVVDSEFDGDIERVTEIVQPISGDIVTEPATTAGLFENHEHSMDPNKKPKAVKRTIAEIRGRQTAGTVSGKLLLEMEEGAVPMETEVEVAADASAEAMGDAAITELIIAAVKDDSLDMAGKLGRIRAILKLDADMTGKSGGDAEPEAEEITEESRRLRDAERKLARMEAKNLLLESGREATDIRVKTLAATPETDRKTLLESWPKKVDASGRPESSPGVIREAVRFEDGLDDITDDDIDDYEKRFHEAAKAKDKATA